MRAQRRHLEPDGDENDAFYNGKIRATENEANDAYDGVGDTLAVVVETETAFYPSLSGYYELRLGRQES